MEVDLIFSTDQLCLLRPHLPILYPDKSSYVICEVTVVTACDIIEITNPPVNLSKLDLKYETLSTISYQVNNLINSNIWCIILLCRIMITMFLLIH